MKTLRAIAAVVADARHRDRGSRVDCYCWRNRRSTSQHRLVDERVLRFLKKRGHEPAGKEQRSIA